MQKQTALFLRLLFGLFAGLCWLNPLQCEFDGADELEENKLDKENNASAVQQKYFFYDGKGSLILNASIPGISPPIVIDTKKYYPTCTTNVYFSFIFRALLNCGYKDICEEGMTICYEGQLVGEHMRPEFNISNVDTPEAKKLIQQCADADLENRPYENEEDKRFRKLKFVPSPGIRYLNVAVETVKNLKTSQMHGSNRTFIESQSENGKRETWKFFVISASFIKQKYYFIAPQDGTIALQIGDRKNLGVRVTDSVGNDIPPVKFTKNHEIFGVENLGGPFPDMNNGGNLRKHVGLWMFYMDFKSNYHTWQAMSTVNPNNTCRMTVEIRGNRMRPCRSYMEDIAILEPVDAYVNMTYTSEVGTIRQQTYGQEDVKATESRWKKEQMKLETTKDKTVDTEETKTMTEDEINEVIEKEKSIHTRQVEKGEFEVSANIPLGPFPVSIGASGGHGYENVNDKFSSTKDRTDKSEITAKSDTSFSETTRSSAMMNSFKSTSGAAETMSQAEFLQTTNAFSSRETVDIKVQLPPNKKVIIQQLMFDCDGNLVKMPFIFYTDGKEVLSLTDNMAGLKRSRPNKWKHQTLGSEMNGGGQCEQILNNSSGTPAVNNEQKEKEKQSVKEMNQLIADYEDPDALNYET